MIQQEDKKVNNQNKIVVNEKKNKVDENQSFKTK